MFEAKLIIGGVARDAEAGAVYERCEPVTDRVTTLAASASPNDARNAANSAAAAFPAWSRTTPSERSEILQKAAALVERRSAEFVTAMLGEIGSNRAWAQFNCSLGADMFRQAARFTDVQDLEKVAEESDGVRSVLQRQPVGVVLGIAPWNAPVVLGIRAIAVPLACGNTTVFKASELCPKTHSLVVEVLAEAGLPDGAANLVLHAPEDAGTIVDTLIAHAAIRRVNFTGSTRVGRMVAKSCAEHLKPCLLELSGKAPLLVLDDADLDAAVEAAAFGAFFNQGQICISTERIIVDRHIADRFVEMLGAKAASLAAGDPNKEELPLGSMISANAALRVRALVDEALSKGAVLVTGGEVSATIMQPTVIDHVDSSMEIYREESFGPVAAVIRASGDDEAVSIANATEFGLASAVFGRDTERAKAVADRLETGVCHINGPTVYDNPRMPFGGCKASGFGRFGGEAGVREFTELRWISIHDRPHAYPI